MKLIIEIPEMAYDAYKEWHKNKVATVEQSLIANGIPYEERPQGDSISREALREAFKAWKTMDDYYHNTDCNDIPFSEAFDLIDNAPAVEYTFEEAFQKTVCEQRLYCPARPQGEWLFHRCSLCGRYDARDNENFCSNCGAKMKNGKLFHVEHTTKGEE